MFAVRAQNISRRFRHLSVIKNFSYDFKENNAYAILGPNGSGKSTLLKILSGYLSPNEGKIIYQNDSSAVEEEDYYRYISLCAPYASLYKELTFEETVHFLRAFKGFYKHFERDEWTEKLGIQKAINEPLKNYSSGMLQKVKLACAFLFNSKIVLLDEPTANFDEEGVELYRYFLDYFSDGRILLLASNSEREYDSVRQRIFVEEYK